MKVVLISTYELGRQPFGLASPAAWLRAKGHEVACADLAVGTLPLLEIREAEFVAFYLPMHTATRLAVPVIDRVRRLNPAATICCYGLYAPLNEAFLRQLGASVIVGGEFEAGLLAALEGHTVPSVSLDRLAFRTPDRRGLPVLARYPKLIHGDVRKKAGYTEASRGCKHLCRHCPVVPVYNGVFRVVPPDVVLEDIRRQVAAGANHITFGDPDFLNGPGHARRVVDALHREFPQLTYDVTAKIEHLLKHRDLLPVLKNTGCLFVTSAVESVDDDTLRLLNKGHTRKDFLEAVGCMRAAGLTLAPTFIPFTPWTTLQGYRDLLRTIADLELIQNVAPVQLSLRLLVTAGSRLLELESIRRVCTDYDAESLVWRWRHRAPEIDRLAREIVSAVHVGTRSFRSRSEQFREICMIAGAEPDFHLPDRATIPYMEEPWFC